MSYFCPDQPSKSTKYLFQYRYVTKKTGLKGYKRSNLDGVQPRIPENKQE